MVLKREPRSDSDSTPSSESRLLAQVRQGSQGATEALFERYRAWLRRCTRGRLPQRGAGLGRHQRRRSGSAGLHLHAPRLVRVEARERDAGLPAAGRREPHSATSCGGRRGGARPSRRSSRFGRRRTARRNCGSSSRATPGDATSTVSGAWRPRDRRLIVGRVELGYNYRQLALLERLPSPDAARMALAAGGGSAGRRHRGSVTTASACSVFASRTPVRVEAPAARAAGGAIGSERPGPPAPAGSPPRPRAATAATARRRRRPWARRCWTALPRGRSWRSWRTSPGAPGPCPATARPTALVKAVRLVMARRGRSRSRSRGRILG